MQGARFVTGDRDLLGALFILSGSAYNPTVLSLEHVKPDRVTILPPGECIDAAEEEIIETRKPVIISVAPNREDPEWDSIVGIVTAHDILLTR